MVYEDYSCRDLLVELAVQIIRQTDTDGIEKIDQPVNAIIKDPDYDNYPYVRLDGDAYALYVKSNSLALENGGNLQLMRAQTDKFTWDLSDTTYLLVKTKLETSDLKIGGVELMDGAADIRASIAADGAQNALFVQSNTLLKKTEFETVMGQAVASPAADTIGARLKSLVDNLNKSQLYDGSTWRNQKSDVNGVAIVAPSTYQAVAVESEHADVNSATTTNIDVILEQACDILALRLDFTDQVEADYISAIEIYDNSATPVLVHKVFEAAGTDNYIHVPATKNIEVRPSQPIYRGAGAGYTVRTVFVSSDTTAQTVQSIVEVAQGVET